ncbi:zinc finger FYVE domain-containing protein 9 isoform 2-T2 [Salvelinus alpinus]
MLKFFSARDDENESLLGALTDDESDALSLMDAKHHWLHRPCLLMLEDGDVTKSGQLGCGHIGSESPAKSKVHSKGVLSPGATKEGPISQLETPAQRLMRQLEEGNCTVTTLSTWGERHFGKASTPLMLIPSKAAVPEVEMKEEKKRPQLPSYKEDSVVEEKELEESERKLQDSPSGSDGISPDLDDTSDRPVEELYEGSHTQGPRLGLQNQTKANGLTIDETNANRAQADSEEGAVGDCRPSPMSPSVDPDNELQAGPAGILSRERGTTLGEVAPVWVPDAHTLVCMMCEVRFTFTKRRHHCRACGKVFCSLCSGLKFRLTHLDGKEGRVCVSCHSTLVKRTPPRGRRRVWFADEILSNEKSDSAPCTPIRGPTFSPLLLRRSIAATIRSATGSPQTSRGTPIAQGPPLLNPLQEVCGPCGWGTATLVSSHISSSANLIPLDGLPPILTSTGVKGDYTVEERPSERVLIQELESGRPNSLVFVLNANLLAMVKLVNYVNRKCWCVTSKGMHAVGQVEVVVLLQCLPEEKSFPKDIFSHFIQLYRDALTVYPCPLYSVRFRKALFGETGHTIMRLLVDFRNYRYTLPVVPGLTVDLEAQRTCIKIPTNGYDELMKALNKSNEHVLAMGACFNVAADSHLICVQGDDGEYQTQAISIHNQPRKVTGSCFFLFSGALKAASGYLAKSSIVEDGLMVQITVETMVELRQSLREMKDYNISCGRIDQSDSQEHVQVQWQEKECTVNKGVISPIDGKSMESISSIKMFQKSEYKANGKVIRWTEVFSLQKGGHHKSQGDHHTEHSRLTERLARAFCLALGPHLKLLKEDGMAKLGLRVTLDSHQVRFVAGSNGLPLPAPYLNALDTVLIPIIHSRGRKRSEEPLVMELIFYILENIS